MFKKLKELTVVKKNNSREETLNTTEPSQERKQTYNQAGHNQSESNHGSPTSLKISLQAIYSKFQNEEKENKFKQERSNDPFRKEKSEKETLIKTNNVLLSNENEKKERREEKIETLKYEIADIPNNPNKYGIDAKKGASVKFWIGLGLLLPIALYLVVFYISASYSVFFKEFKIGATSFAQIFDPEAFIKAWNQGVLAGIFVTFIPFVFFGLGFLIHMFGETKSILNFVKIGILFIITFVFDVILAYVIEDKIYQLNKTANSPDFDISIAFQKFEFWGIIFAGFIVYIIWGLVFDIVMKEHKEKDKIKMAIGERKSKITIEKDAVEKNNVQIHQLKENNSNFEGRIDELNKLIDAVIIPVKEYKLYASEYMQGWITSINELIGKKENKIALIEECNIIYEKHLEKVGSSGEYQNKLYISNN